MTLIDAKIAAVSYLNTVPFIYGISHADELRADLLLCPPAECAKAFRDKKVDIALIPAGALPVLPDAEIITDFCIGAEQSVRSVVVVSNTPINEVKRIWLDSHSMTSALLTRVLANEMWHIKPEWKELNDYSILDNPTDGDAYLLIGDKVFDYEGRFTHSHDLADCWLELTDKPFVFAVWVARKGAVSDDVIEALELSLTFGVERIWEALVEHGHDGKDYAYSYLTGNIDYLFDNRKREALELFREKSLKAVAGNDPG